MEGKLANEGDDVIRENMTDKEVGESAIASVITRCATSLLRLGCLIKIVGRARGYSAIKKTKIFQMIACD